MEVLVSGPIHTKQKTNKVVEKGNDYGWEGVIPLIATNGKQVLLRVIVIYAKCLLIIVTLGNVFFFKFRLSCKPLKLI